MFGFGSPTARAQGIGYVQELVARLTHTPIEIHNSSTNATLNDNPITFPLDQSLYVDATHDAVFLSSKCLFLVFHNMLLISLFLTSYHGAEFDVFCRVWPFTFHSCPSPSVV